jgi:energy-coupling factor transport system ATP-binding protein
MVPHNPADLLYLDTVAAECAAAGLPAPPAGAAWEILGRFELDPDAHPRDLSEGQRLALALAVQLASPAPVLLLDEPTRGLDYPAKATLSAILRQLAAGGTAICIATHDVEFAAATADRALVMATGDIVAQGPAAQVLSTSNVFAPQIAKVFSPRPLLTVGDVASALLTFGPPNPTQPGQET